MSDALRIIGIIVFAILSVLFYLLDERAKDKKDTVSGWYGKYTLWSFLFYFSILFLAIFVFVFFTG